MFRVGNYVRVVKSDYMGSVGVVKAITNDEDCPIVVLLEPKNGVGEGIHLCCSESILEEINKSEILLKRFSNSRKEQIELERNIRNQKDEIIKALIKEYSQRMYDDISMGMHMDRLDIQLDVEHLISAIERVNCEVE